MAKPSITFQSFNPYECRFPGRRVVLRELLQLIKALRERGYAVCVEPEDGTRLNWRQENGLSEWLQDPVVMLCASVPVAVMANLLTDLLKGAVGRWVARDKPPILIQIPKGREKGLYTQVGERIGAAAATRTGERPDLASAYEMTRLYPSPLPSYPEPILLEHTAQIVGWGRLGSDDVGLLVHCQITDAEVRRKLTTGELGGFSFGALIYDSECSVCGRQYVDCNHIAGATYNGIECIAWVAGADLAEVSVVAVPANPDARVVRTS